MDPRQGWFFVVRTTGPIAAAIRLITRSKYNHAGWCVHPGIRASDGTWQVLPRIIEARFSGARTTDWAYESRPHLWSGALFDLTPAQEAMVPVIAASLERTPYGFLDITSLGCLQYGIRPRLIRDIVRSTKRLVCSQLVDYALLRLGVNLFTDHREPMDVTPGDLARLTRCPPAQSAARP